MIRELKDGEFVFLNNKSFIRRVNDKWINENNAKFVINDQAINPIILDNVFNDETYDDLLQYVRDENNFKNFKFSQEKDFHYNYIQNNVFINTLHNNLIEKANKIFKEKVKPSYNQLTFYNHMGTCPMHVDRKQCKYTIDLLVDQEIPSKPWPIWIDDKSYNMKPNQAVCYSGTDSIHWRKRINQQWASLIFFHFVPINFEGSLS